MDNTAILAALARLEAGQVRLDAGQASTKEQLARLKADQDRLAADQADTVGQFSAGLARFRDEFMDLH